MVKLLAVYFEIRIIFRLLSQKTLFFQDSVEFLLNFHFSECLDNLAAYLV